MLKFSISSWFSLERIYLSKSLSISSRLSILLTCGHLRSSLVILCISVVPSVTSPFSFLILFIWVLFLFSLMSLLRGLTSFICFFWRTSFSFHWSFLLLFFCLCFAYFCSDLYDLFCLLKLLCSSFSSCIQNILQCWADLQLPTVDCLCIPQSERLSFSPRPSMTFSTPGSSHWSPLTAPWPQGLTTAVLVAGDRLSTQSSVRLRGILCFSWLGRLLVGLKRELQDVSFRNRNSDSA